MWTVRATLPIGRISHVEAALNASYHPLYNGEACSSIPCKKITKGVLFVILIIFDHSSFNYIKFHLLFFQLRPLTFDFYIKFVLLFYDVSWLILYVLISNLDYWLFYEILISFQFRPWTYDLIFIFFILGPRSLDFYFCFWFFCEFGFSF